MNPMQGRWQLAARHFIQSEVENLDEEGLAPQSALGEWLNGNALDMLADVWETQGLLLDIHADGSFTEQLTGTPKIIWFAADGCMSDPEPFAGQCTMVGNLGYLLPPEIDRWAIPKEGEFAPALLRYDDGDTMISEHVMLDRGRLLRCVNVVTDELYLNRVLLVYDRA